VPLPEQEGLSRGTWQKLEMFGSKELAYAITMQDYELFMAINQVQNKSLSIIQKCSVFLA